ncbi:MAG: hypothetical protein ACFE9C_03665 [Candidatus Hodarchaeota archaeon]
MNNSKLYEIVNMDGITVEIPQTSHFSIGTSPYYAHQHGLAIDIYPNLTLENYEVSSPISGKVVMIKTLKAPKAKFPEGVNYDSLILISNSSNSKILWKMMHVSPNVDVGDKINIGDPLGTTIRNGYFAYWSSPHIHLELRPSNDAIRAQGGKNFTLSTGKQGDLVDFSENLDTRKIPVEIHSIYPEIILAYLPEYYYQKINPFYGFKAKINNFNCILDGGIPHYKNGTILFQQQNISNELDPVYLGTTKIGILNEIKGQLGFFKFNDIKFYLNNKEIRGISLYLANFLPLIKIIPYKRNQFSFKLKSIQYLKLISCEVSTK